MKFIIIGLGNFGASLCIKLMEDGHEVIGVDKSITRVNSLQDKITHSVCMDTTDESSIQTLPMADTDYVIIGIGEDTGASIMTTALLKKYCSKKIISRAISDLHQTVLEAMGIEEILHPEADTARRLASRFMIKGALVSFSLDDEFDIIEAEVPESYVGMTIQQAKFREQHHINIVTIIRKRRRRGILGNWQTIQEVIGVVSPNTVLEPHDILVIFGRADDIEKLLNE